MQKRNTAAARICLMGGEFDLVTPAQVMAFIARSVESGAKAVIGNHNMHSLYLMRRHPGMAAYFGRADIIQIDSVPLILWGQTLGHPVDRGHRSTYLDWRDDFWRLASDKGWRVYLLGSQPGVTETMIARVSATAPGAVLAGRDGYFDHAPESADNAAVVAAINAFAPDVLLVGMGMPLQEAWIHQNVDRLEAGVCLSVGGAFDYEAGVQAPAPRWLGMLGLEWLFRFALQPRRLFGRYFVEPWSLIGPALDDLQNKGRPAEVSPKERLSTPSER